MVLVTDHTGRGRKRQTRRLPSQREILAAKPGRYYYGYGLCLIVSQDGRGRWVFRYTKPSTRKVTEVTIGPSSLTLFEVHTKAEEMRQLLAKGIDPVEHKQKQKAAHITWAEVCDRWTQLKKPGWTASNIENVELRLYKHGKALAKKSVAHIDPDTIHAALKPLWAKVPKQARKTLSMWARLLDYAKYMKYRTGDNPAAWTGNMEFRFHTPQRVMKHFPSMEYRDVPAFIKRLHGRERSTSALALELLVLTATRSGEVREMQWSEIDWDDKVWTIPAERMKANKPHRVPLCDRVMQILAVRKEYSYGSPFVFTGYKRVALDEKALRLLLMRMNVATTVHGFRSTFRTWATEKTEASWDLIELCLAHNVGTKVAQAYQRGDALDKRRELMRQWEAFCSGGSE